MASGAERLGEHTLQDLDGVERAVIDHRQDRRSALDVQDAPEQAQQADRDGHVCALIEVQRAERQAEVPRRAATP